jgi:hypothetical protein
LILIRSGSLPLFTRRVFAKSGFVYKEERCYYGIITMADLRDDPPKTNSWRRKTR